MITRFEIKVILLGLSRFGDLDLDLSRLTGDLDLDLDTDRL